jgi:type I restriction enzyme S subunit
MVPQLRFPGYSGEWEEKKLGEVVESFEYGLNASAKEFDGKNKYLRITDIDDESHKFKFDSLTSPNIDFDVADNYKLKYGDILFARTGASVGKTYQYVESDGLVYFAGFLIRARIMNEYDTDFIFQNTMTFKYNSFIAITSQRSGQPGVNAKEYGGFKIIFPNLKEQQKIGSFFTQLDDLIALHQQKLAHLQERKKGLLQKMFPKAGEKVPELRFPGFSGDWEEKKLGEVAERLKSYSLSRDVETSKNTGIKYVHYGDIHTKVADKITNQSLIPNIKFSEYEILQKGDLILADASEDYQGIAIPSVIIEDTEFKIVAGLHTIALRPQNVDSIFLYYLIYSPIFRRYGYKTGTGMKVFGITATNVLKFESAFPTFEEQQRIGLFLDQIDESISSHQHKLNNLRKRKKALLQQMFI